MDYTFPVFLECLYFSHEEVGTLSHPGLTFPHLQVDERDFVMNIDHIASFSVRDGNHVSFHPHENADMASIKLFLNGSILGAVLHQRGVLEKYLFGQIVCSTIDVTTKKDWFYSFPWIADKKNGKELVAHAWLKS